MIQQPYPINGRGRNATITVPLKEWEALQDKLRAFEIVESVKRGYREAVEMHKAGNKGKTWEEFMQELNED